MFAQGSLKGLRWDLPFRSLPCLGPPANSCGRSLKKYLNCRSRGRVRHRQSAKRKPQDPTGEDCQTGRTQTVAEDLPQPEGQSADGTGNPISDPRRVFLNRQQSGSRPKALPAGHRRPLRKHAAKCAAATGRFASHGAANGFPANETPSLRAVGFILLPSGYANRRS